MKTIMLLSLLGLLVGCGSAKFEAIEQQVCSIEGKQIVCPDGTIAPLPQDGRDGTDGKAGS